MISVVSTEDAGYVDITGREVRGIKMRGREEEGGWEREGGREGEREGGREGGRERGREGGRERQTETEREREGKEGRREEQGGRGRAAVLFRFLCSQRSCVWGGTGL